MIKDEDPLLPAQCQKNIVLKMFAGFMGMLIIKGVWFCGVCGSVVCFFFNIYIVLGARGCFFEDSSALTYSKAKCIYKKQMIDSLLNDT